LFLIVVIGAEAGIANVRKFSYLAGANGGGLFATLYFIALIVAAIPTLMSEMPPWREERNERIGGARRHPDFLATTTDSLLKFARRHSIIRLTRSLSLSCVATAGGIGV
jgi:SNF family Na+-dependent transporter